MSDGDIEGLGYFDGQNGGEGVKGKGGVDHYREMRGVREIRGGELTQKILGISMSNVYIEL